jgi:hypothetical protein
VLESATAVRARPAVRQRHDGDPISLANRSNVGADGHDLACELMPEDLRVLRAGEGVRIDGSDYGAGDVFVQVRPTDAARGDADDDVAGTGRTWLADILDAQIARGMETKGLHSQGTIRAARRRAKRSVNELSVS